MTIDEKIANQALAGQPLPFNAPQPKALAPLSIPGLIGPLETPGVDGGVNYSMIDSDASGLLVVVYQYVNMREGDWIEIFWGDSTTSVASTPVREADIGNNVYLNISRNAIKDGVSEVTYRITRVSGNKENSDPLNVLVRTVFPGGADPQPDTPNHEGLAAPELDLPPGTIIDEDIAREGVTVTISRYENMREYDLISLSWGGEIVKHLVTQAEVDAGFVDIVVTEEIILDAGDADGLVVVYQVMDEVENVQRVWSMRSTVDVEVGTGMFDSPLIDNPDPDADPWDVIDLDKLGEADLLVEVIVDPSNGLLVGDEVALTWVGTTSQGQAITVELPAQTVRRSREVLDFFVPNADLRQLGLGRGSASYSVVRNGAVEGASKRAAVTFHGVERGLPKPTVLEAQGGVLDPDLAQATVDIPIEFLRANDSVMLTWRGTRSDGNPLLYEDRQQLSAGWNGRPVTFPISGASNILPLKGGRVSVYYTIGRSGGVAIESERELLMVGEAQFQLPAPYTRPAAQNGMLDPDELPEWLELVIDPYPNMADGQRVHVFWSATVGEHFEDHMEINSFSVGREVVFELDREHIRQNLGGEVELWYEVREDGEATRPSARTTLKIGAQQGQLPLPEVPESNDGILNPVDAIRGATVRIPVEADLKFGDDVDVNWIGSKPNGTTTVTRPVFQEDVGKPFELTIGYEFVAANADGNVVVSYEVFGVDGSRRTSETLNLRVQSAELPLPVIDEAGEGNQLNPDDVLNGATVVIDASAQFKEGDEGKVTITSSAQGGSTTIPYRVPVGGTGQPVRVKVPYEVINASTGTSFKLEYDIIRSGGGTPEKSNVNTYTVSREVGAGPLLVMGARFNASTYRASSAPRMLSAFHRNTLRPLLAEWRYEGSTVWTAKERWFDNKPWLKLHVRSKDEGVVLNPANIVGNGIDTSANGLAAFVAMRDEGATGSPGEVDMVAWGNEGYGGKLSPDLIAIRDIAEVSCTSNAYAACRRDGYVVTWGTKDSGGNPPTDNGSYVQVKSNAQAFVGLKQDGSLFAWGKAAHGVPVSGDAVNHNDFVDVCGASMAFAARRASGHVVAWGDATNGGKLKPGQEGFSDIVQVTGNYAAFAALRDPGNGASTSVIAWGAAAYGGDVTEEIARLTNVKALGGATAQAFSVLLDTNQVRAWGPQSHGGVVPDNIKNLTNVVEITSTWHAFCARLSSGNVVAWGNDTNGGLLPEDIARRSDIVQVVGSSWSFAGLCRDGSVVAWGAPATGGDTSKVAAKLVNVRAIYANTHGFTALTADGAVVTWGVPAGGGDSDSQQQYLTNKVTTGRAMTVEEVQAESATALQATEGV